MTKAGLAQKVKERPIIFGAESVRAILEGRKTQTRRVVQGLPPSISVAGGIPESDYQYFFTDFEQNLTKRCPYGRPWPYCDRLWVREAWGDVTLAFQSHECEEPRVWAYRADEAVHNSGGFLEHMGDSGIVCKRWRTPIFMPRWMSRIALALTDVRVERLQEISEADITAEGITEGDGVWAGSLRAAFRDGWDELNAKRGFPFKSNPFVWVLSFKRVTD